MHLKIVRISKVVVALWIFCLMGTPLGLCREPSKLSVAVEFNDHAACAYVAREKGWFEQEGLKVSSFDCYLTGMGLAAALARGAVQAAYVCLIPAINVYANAGVPVKVIAGTHKYGYGLVVNPKKIRHVKDLQRPGVKIGCVRVGGVLDVILHKTIDQYGLDEDIVLKNIHRMPPPVQLINIRMEKLDASFLPEQWASMSEELGFATLLTAQDIWPGMQGSVLVVRESILKKHPRMARGLVEVTRRATEWINLHKEEAAKILARELSMVPEKNLHVSPGKIIRKLDISSRTLLRSMKRLKYCNDIDPGMIQRTIDYMSQLGYLRNNLKADDILNLRFLK